jgi:hypothetical protein
VSVPWTVASGPRSTWRLRKIREWRNRARRLAAAGLRAAGRTRGTDARALAILARAAFDTGQIKRSRQLFRRAQATAERAHDRELAATIQLDMLDGIADWLPTGEADRIATESARAATITGNPHLAARYHLVAAGRRLRLGLADQAAAHLRMADMLLQANPNPWLAGRLHLTRATAHAARREAAAGARQARKALACARLSGHAVTVGAVHAELAHIQLAEGRLRRAFRRCSNGLQQSVGGFPVRIRLLELLAQVELVQGRLPRCGAPVRAGGSCARKQRLRRGRRAPGQAATGRTVRARRCASMRACVRCLPAPGYRARPFAA